MTRTNGPGAFGAITLCWIISSKLQYLFTLESHGSSSPTSGDSCTLWNSIRISWELKLCKDIQTKFSSFQDQKQYKLTRDYLSCADSMDCSLPRSPPSPLPILPALACEVMSTRMPWFDQYKNLRGGSATNGLNTLMKSFHQIISKEELLMEIIWH